MIVLTRQAGEAINIGGGIKLMVTRIEGNRVRLGISADRAVNVRRGEHVARIPANQPQAPLRKHVRRVRS